jgi:hypothetical protein
MRYASRGLYVFPILPNAKTPLTQHGVLDATTDTEQIREWWQKRPRANIGLACGEKSGIVALDFDVKDGKRGRETLEFLESRFPDTLTAETPSHGFHKLFKYVHGLQNAVEVLPGLDIRTNGGYILLAPSVVNGKGYRWTQKIPPHEFPAGLITLLQKPKPMPLSIALPRRWAPNRLQAIRRATRYVECVPGAIEGEAGDVTTYKLTCRLVRGFALSDDEALALLSYWNRRCRPAWSERELMAKIASARRNGTEPYAGRLVAR